MPVFISTIVGAVLWITLWAFDVKALDSFLLMVAIILGGTLAWMIGPFVRNLIKP